MRIKIGIVGLNSIAKAHYTELRRSNKYEISGIYDPDETGELGRITIFNDFKRFINEAMPSVLLVCVDSQEILNVVNTCVKYVKYIIIASRLPKNTSDLRELRYIAQTNKVLIYPCFSERFDPVVSSLKKSLLKEEEIYSVDLFHQNPALNGDIITLLSIHDIALLRYFLGDISYDFNASFTNITNQKSSDNVHISYKNKNQVLTSIINSLSGNMEQLLIRVNAKSGIYFADILEQKLHQLNENGRINLKVNNEENKLFGFYEKYSDFYADDESKDLVSLDEVIAIKGLFNK